MAVVPVRLTLSYLENVWLGFWLSHAFLQPCSLRIEHLYWNTVLGATRTVRKKTSRLCPQKRSPQGTCDGSTHGEAASCRALQRTPQMLLHQQDKLGKITVVTKLLAYGFFKSDNSPALLTVLVLLRWQSGFHERVSSALS